MVSQRVNIIRVAWLLPWTHSGSCSSPFPGLVWSCFSGWQPAAISTWAGGCWATVEREEFGFLSLASDPWHPVHAGLFPTLPPALVVFWLSNCGHYFYGAQKFWCVGGKEKIDFIFLLAWSFVLSLVKCLRKLFCDGVKRPVTIWRNKFGAQFCGIGGKGAFSDFVGSSNMAIFREVIMICLVLHQHPSSYWFWQISKTEETMSKILGTQLRQLWLNHHFD